MTEYPAEGEIAHTEAYLVIEEDLRDLLLGYEDMNCPSCEDSKMTFQDDGGGIEAFCEEPTYPPCRMIYTMFDPGYTSPTGPFSFKRSEKMGTNWEIIEWVMGRLESVPDNASMHVKIALSYEKDGMWFDV